MDRQQRYGLAMDDLARRSQSISTYLLQKEGSRSFGELGLAFSEAGQLQIWRQGCSSGCGRRLSG